MEPLSESDVALYWAMVYDQLIERSPEFEKMILKYGCEPDNAPVSE
ncbi:MAG TPA: hypothetical protein VJ742_07255 [Nitrososphaera sp.]|nr:hypothetical protein [Nitrososphaera sp.]